MDESTFLGVMSLLLNAQLERNGNERSVVQAEETAAAVFAAQRRLAGQPAARRRILWVDDNPENNVLERQAFDRVGVRVDGAPDVTTALGRLPYEEYARSWSRSRANETVMRRRALRASAVSGPATTPSRCSST